MQALLRPAGVETIALRATQPVRRAVLGYETLYKDTAFRDVRHLGVRQRQALVAVVSAGVGPCPGSADDHWWLWSLATVPAARRTGAASRLVADVLAAAAAAGAHRVCADLRVAPDAEGFWARYDPTPAGPRERHAGYDTVRVWLHVPG